MTVSNPVSGFDLTIEHQTGYEFRVVFDKPTHPELRVDEPPPLGKDQGPNPARLLAAAIGSCLSASLAFCLNRADMPLSGLTAKVHADLVRNERKRLRVGGVRVELHPTLATTVGNPSECLERFEDFCVVTESVRAGVPVEVSVVFEPATASTDAG
ncbi:MAG TPA: OsmC family protein [Polyangiaceae bacterium]|nr:OsmC family protein [Polyangiaceae bacterium]